MSTIWQNWSPLIFDALKRTLFSYTAHFPKRVRMIYRSQKSKKGTLSPLKNVRALPKTGERWSIYSRNLGLIYRPPLAIKSKQGTNWPPDFCGRRSKMRKKETSCWAILYVNARCTIEGPSSVVVEKADDILSSSFPCPFRIYGIRLIGDTLDRLSRRPLQKTKDSGWRRLD